MSEVGNLAFTCLVEGCEFEFAALCDKLQQMLLRMHLADAHGRTHVICDELQQPRIQPRIQETHANRAHMNGEQEPGLRETKIKQQGQSVDNGGKGKMQSATVEYCTVSPCAEAGCFFREQKKEGSRPINHQTGCYSYFKPSLIFMSNFIDNIPL